MRSFVLKISPQNTTDLQSLVFLSVLFLVFDCETGHGFLADTFLILLQATFLDDLLAVEDDWSDEVVLAFEIFLDFFRVMRLAGIEAVLAIVNDTYSDVWN